jgi:hypothetical protein
MLFIPILVKLVFLASVCAACTTNQNVDIQTSLKRHYLGIIRVVFLRVANSVSK